MRRGRSLPVLALLLAALLAVAGCGSGGGSSSQGSTATGASASQGKKRFSPQSEVAGTSYAQRLLRFGTRPLTAKQISTLVKRGSLPLGVHVPKPGTVSAFAQSQLGFAIVKTAVAAPVRAPGRGTVDLNLRLTPAVRRVLAKGHKLLTYLAIKYSRSPTMQQLTIPLKATP